MRLKTRSDFEAAWRTRRCPTIDFLAFSFFLALFMKNFLLDFRPIFFLFFSCVLSIRPIGATRPRSPLLNADETTLLLHLLLVLAVMCVVPIYTHTHGWI